MVQEKVAFVCEEVIFAGDGPMVRGVDKDFMEMVDSWRKGCCWTPWNWVLWPGN